MLGRTHAWWRGWRERQRQYKIERALFKAANGGVPMGGPVPPQAFGEGLTTSPPPKPPPASES